MKFDPVRTVADLVTLDESEVHDGYLSAERGDPEPGEKPRPSVLARLAQSDDRPA